MISQLTEIVNVFLKLVPLGIKPAAVRTARPMPGCHWRGLCPASVFVRAPSGIGTGGSKPPPVAPAQGKTVALLRVSFLPSPLSPRPSASALATTIVVDTIRRVSYTSRPCQRPPDHARPRQSWSC